MAELAPGRFALGVGSSSDVIVERWNAMSFDEPYKRVRDTVRFLREALDRRARSTPSTRRSRCAGSAWGGRSSSRPRSWSAALRPGHAAPGRARGRRRHHQLAVGRRRASRWSPEVGPGKEIVARIFVCPTEDAERARFVGRMGIAAYLNVAVYAAFHEWLGPGPAARGDVGGLARRATARRRWPPSPTRWSTRSSSTAPRPSAGPTSAATSTTASPCPSWPCSPAATTSPTAVENLAPGRLTARAARPRRGAAARAPTAEQHAASAAVDARVCGRRSRSTSSRAGRTRWPASSSSSAHVGRRAPAAGASRGTARTAGRCRARPRAAVNSAVGHRCRARSAFTGPTSAASSSTCEDGRRPRRRA